MNYVAYHIHDDTSNCNGFADSCTKYKEYIKLAKKQGMKAIAFSNHGSIYDWIKKKQECDKAGIKYIHGVELYVCKKLEDDSRGCHIGLYAKNFKGVLELNELVSIATSKGELSDNSDRHMYYNPRISLEELMNTSENIIVTSACLASPLNKWDSVEDSEYFRKLILWFVAHKDRCFLEIQHHNIADQKMYNRKLYAYSEKTGIPLIAGTDSHSSNEYKAECRIILQKYKKCYYESEEGMDLVWKTYDELVEAYRVQRAIPESAYMKAIENTNVLADMVEDFTLDKSFKYPTLYGNDVRTKWQNLIVNSLEEKIKNKELKLPSKIKINSEKYLMKNDNPKSDIEKKIYQQYLDEYKWSCNTTDEDMILEYKTRIKEEFDVMCKLGMESFMLFMSELITWAKSNNIPVGVGRGSVCGSVIAYITNITDVDPLVWNTVFSRFCNEDRISLGDIDVDFAPEDRVKVYEYIIERFTPAKTAYIAIFGTLQDRGCIDTLAGGLGYTDLDKVKEIKDRFDEYFSSYSKIVQEEVNLEELVENGETETSSITFDNHKIYMNHVNDSIKSKLSSIKKQYDILIKENQDLFYYLDGLKGTIISKGVHPSGIIGSPITLADNIGLFYKDGNKNMPVSICSMKAVDSLNYVKFDILGLKTVGIIKDTCEYIGIPYPKASDIDWSDVKVWDNMVSMQQGVFQFEGDYAFDLLKRFRPYTINHMSMVNASLRPSGKSYRERLISGEKNKNPSKEIDDLLASNNGYLIFQEDTIKFLTDICDFSGSLADTTRRAIGKKDTELLNQQLPKILDGYCNHSKQPRDIAEKEAKTFLQIVEDSSEYQFGLNHSTAYSMNGFECVMLRTYYPLAFTASYLNRAENKDDITNGIALAEQLGIKVKPIKFGKSLSKYTIDESDNSIYKGIESIKFCNSIIAEELMKLYNSKKYISFIELLDDVSTKTSLDSRQIRILIGLNFFSDFGKNKYLLEVYKLYAGIKENGKTIVPSFRTCKVLSKEKLSNYNITIDEARNCSAKETGMQFRDIDNIKLLNFMTKKLKNEPLSVIEQVKFDIEYLTYTTYCNPEEVHADNLYIVVDFKVFNDVRRPHITLRNLKTGEEIHTKIKSPKIFMEQPFGMYSILFVNSFSSHFKQKLISGNWVESSEEEITLDSYEVKTNEFE